ncbi:MAG: hypothetical protein AAGJ81_15710 [Verrucomicrobiota bacterium]
MKKTLSALAFCSILLSGCSEDRIQNGSVIEHRGFYALAKGASLEIFEAKNGLLNIRHSYSDGNSSEWIDGIIEKETNWFIYVSNFDEIWLAKENDLILLYEEENAPGSYSVFSCNKPGTLVDGVVEKIPDAVFSKIEPSLRSKIQQTDQAAGGNG